MDLAEVKVVAIGAGGHGSEMNAYMADLRRAGWRGEFLGFLDDTQPAGHSGDMELLGSIADFAARWRSSAAEFRYIAAIGDNQGRRNVAARVDELFAGELRPWTLIHPFAVAGPSAIGEGTLLAPGAVVTARARIGRHCILNVKASVSHDCEIGDFVSLNPGVTICGWCRIGDGVCIGAGATVIDRIRIGEGAIIGAGAVVVRDIPPNVTAMGVPARVVGP